MTEDLFAGDPSPIDPTRVRTVPQHQAKRKRMARNKGDGSAYQKQRQLPSELSTLSELPLNILNRIQKIASPETLTTSPSDKGQGDTVKSLGPSDPSIEGQLSWHLRRYENRGRSNEQFLDIPRRLFLASIAGLYIY
jgi:hypothetical protein